MRTRCPKCATVFRITSEQLRARGGKVRCGSCQTVFNAFDHLEQEAPVATPIASVPPVQPPPAARAPLATIPAAPQGIAPTPSLSTVTPADASHQSVIQPIPEASPLVPPAPTIETAEQLQSVAPEIAPLPPASDSPAPAVTAIAEITVENAADPAALEEAPQETASAHAQALPDDETPEQSTQAARDAGLVAVRDLSETQAFNRWAAGTLAGNPLAGLETEEARHPAWPFTLTAFLLLITLLGQLVYFFRTDLVQRWPSTSELFTALEIDVPLPRLADQVSIEASDLQSDNGRGLLILSATLKNRATWAQDWPVLELTLTDAHDAVVARRVLQPADYLPPKADHKAFAGQSDIGLRLWVEAKDTAASGYRLYVFYP